MRKTARAAAAGAALALAAQGAQAQGDAMSTALWLSAMEAASDEGRMGGKPITEYAIVCASRTLVNVLEGEAAHTHEVVRESEEVREGVRAAHHLTRAMKAMIGEGWQPMGGAAYVSDASGGPTWCQGVHRR